VTELEVPLLLSDLLKDLPDPAGLLTVEPASPDRRGQLCFVSFSDRYIARETLFETLVGTVAVGIVSVLGEDRLDQDVQRVSMRTPSQPSILPLQPLRNL